MHRSVRHLLRNALRLLRPTTRTQRWARFQPRLEVLEDRTVPAAFTQLTQGGMAAMGSFQPSISADGTRVVFQANADLTGNNAAGRHEIYLYDVRTAGLTQITSPALDGDSYGPEIDGNGDRVVFYSTADLTGGNPAHDEEVFLYDIASKHFTQVTSTGTGNNFTPTIDGDGGRIAFVNSTDASGLHANVLVYDVPSAALTLLMSAPNDSHTAVRPAISADGQHVVFASTGNPTGLNPTGSYQLFVEDLIPGNINQLTSVTGPVQFTNPSINADGSRIAFQSTADLVGQNADGNFEVYFYDTSAGFTQVTHTTSGFNAVPVFSADGSTIVFESTANLLGDDGDGNIDLYLYNAASGAISTLTSTSPANSLGVLPAMSADGNRIVLQSNADLTGGNASGAYQIFLATLSPSPDTDYVSAAWAGLPNGVDPDGPGPATAIGTDAFTTIQQGIDAVVAGGTVHVAAGVYHENIAIGRSAVLQGSGAASTLLDGTALGGYGVVASQGSAVTIAGLGIQHFDTALYAHDLNALNLTDVAFGTSNGNAGLATSINEVRFTSNAAGQHFVAAGNTFGRPGEDVLAYTQVGQVFLEGAGGSDTFDFTFGAIGTPVTAIDTGGTGSDRVVVSDPIGADTVTVTDMSVANDTQLIGYQGMARMTLTTSGGGSDSVYVRSTAPGTLTEVITSGGNNVLYINSVYDTLDTMLGPLSVDVGAGHNEAYVCEDQSSIGDTMVLTPTSIYSLRLPFSMTYTATGGDFAKGFVVELSLGDDTMYVSGIAPNSTTGFYGEDGHDTFLVSSPTGTLDGMNFSIDANHGTAALYVSESGRTADDVIQMSGHQITSALGVFSVYFTASEGGNFARGVTFVGGAGDDVVDVLGTAAPGIFTAVYTGPGADLVRVHDDANSGYNLLVDGGAPAGGTSGDQLDVIAAAGASRVLTTSFGAGNGLFTVLDSSSLSNILYFDFEGAAAT